MHAPQDSGLRSTILSVVQCVGGELVAFPLTQRVTQLSTLHSYDVDAEYLLGHELDDDRRQERDKEADTCSQDSKLHARLGFCCCDLERKARDLGLEAFKRLTGHGCLGCL